MKKKTKANESKLFCETCGPATMRGVIQCRMTDCAFKHLVIWKTWEAGPGYSYAYTNDLEFAENLEKKFGKGATYSKGKTLIGRQFLVPTKRLAALMRAYERRRSPKTGKMNPLENKDLEEREKSNLRYEPSKGPEGIPDTSSHDIRPNTKTSFFDNFRQSLTKTSCAEILGGTTNTANERSYQHGRYRE